MTATIENFREQRGMYLGGEVGSLVRSLPPDPYVVRGLILPSSVNLLVGDSGIGKTALGYQLALTVAAGIPFVGIPTQRGKVLFMDYENVLWDFHRILEQQRRHLALDAFPADLTLWPMRPSFRDGDIHEAILKLRPQLVIVDSLRSFAPTLERSTSRAAGELRRLRALIRQCGTALLLMHHVRKPRHGGKRDLEDGELIDWMAEAAGSRAIINQTDTRLAIAPRNGTDLLVLRGQARTRGEIGPIFLRRCWDERGEPLGYERAANDLALLHDDEQRDVYLRLPDSFELREAARIYDRPPGSTHRSLQRLISIGLIEQVGYGKYRKVTTSPVESAG